MILLTVPVLFPVVVSLGFDPVWFGIIVVRHISRIPGSLPAQAGIQGF